MRLLSSSFTASSKPVFKTFYSLAPPYAILSHRWGDDEDEVSYQDFLADRKRDSSGFEKIVACCELARAANLSWVWIDTCCIDKSSSAELSEAINSMFRWYAGSSITFVLMADVWFSDLLDRNDPNASIWQATPQGAMRLKSRAYVRLASSSWFTRGWTLQELLAPKSEVIFVTKNWKRFATKSELLDDLEDITGIERRCLARPELIKHASIAQRMSWASRRVTTREEDAAYCLLGIFDVNMPLLYGEGKKAFMRLQLEIIKLKSDESIFAWKNTSNNVSAPYGLLAPEPAVFAHSGRVVNFHLESRLPFSMTNQGLELRIPAGQAPIPIKQSPRRHNDYAAVNIQVPMNVPGRPFQLACGYFGAKAKTQDEREAEARRMPIELQLRKVGNHWQRVQCDRLDISERSMKIDGAAFSLYYVRQPGLQSWM